MKQLFSLALILLLSYSSVFSCTTAVISGKYTKNGRPLLWKLRDTESFKNKLKFFADGKYNYIGLINSDDIEGIDVWGGSNDTGFSIMNSASFNVNMQDTSKLKDQEGRFMKLALQQCSSLSDFEALLKKQTKPMGLAAHFGVLDGKGNVAFYEVNNYTYTKYDANDSSQAPNGYILRTNFSFTGKKNIGYGFIRFQQAQDLLYQADAEDMLNVKTVIQNFSRCLKHPILNKDYRDIYSQKQKNNDFVSSSDLITRHGSSSMIMIEGVAANESPLLTSIWTMVGFPNTCIAIPVWLAGGNNLPKILSATGDNNSDLNQWALDLKDKCYPISRSAGYKYLKISELINANNTGIIQKIEILENEIMDKTESKLKIWHSTKNNKKAIHEFYKYMDSACRQLYKDL